MLKMNVQRLCELLAEAPEEETVSIGEANLYLLRHVLIPALLGKAPRLREIDYSKFDEDEISALGNYGEEVLQFLQQLGQFSDTIARIEPIPASTRQFC